MFIVTLSEIENLCCAIKWIPQCELCEKFMHRNYTKLYLIIIWNTQNWNSCKIYFYLKVYRRLNNFGKLLNNVPLYKKKIISVTNQNSNTVTKIGYGTFYAFY